MPPKVKSAPDLTKQAAWQHPPAAGEAPLAMRYAKALMELASDARKVDDVASDLKQLSQMIHDNEGLAKAINAPQVGRESHAQMITELVKKAGANDITRRFVGVLAKNRRLDKIDTITWAFMKLLAEQRGEVEAEIISAQPLSKDHVTQITKTLKDQLGRDVNANVKVDPSLLGGLIIKMGSKMVDDSLKTKIERLGRNLKQAA